MDGSESVKVTVIDDDARGLSVVCYAGTPHWFNAFLERYQRARDISLRRRHAV